MLGYRKTLTAALVAGGLVASAGAPAGALLDVPLVPTIELEADTAVLDALDWDDAYAAHVTGAFDPSDEAGRYDDPFFVGWSAFLPAYPITDYTPSTENDCIPGNIQCVDNVIRRMTKRYERLGCDHNAVFALTYLLTTEEYKRFWETGAFENPKWLNHYDAVFGQFYFDAYDSWYGKGGGATPPAWRVAFAAADGRDVTGMGNVMLGMNGHIRRDLPFVLEAIGLRNADGTSRKADHDRVNIFLHEVSKYVIDEVGRRHDPSLSSGADVPYTTVDDTASMHAIIEWREEAWRKAELLLSATTTEERDRVARWIENEAAASAIAIRHLFRSSDASVRDAHCAAWLSGS
jgi:hypothetical protein